MGIIEEIWNLVEESIKINNRARESDSEREQISREIIGETQEIIKEIREVRKSIINISPKVEILDVEPIPEKRVWL